MTSPRDPDSIVAAWLDEGPTRLPESTRRAIRISTETSSQKRRPVWLPRRIPLMNPLPRVAVVAIVLVAAVGGAVYLFAPASQNSSGGAPNPTPTATVAPASGGSAAPPSPSPLDTATWTTYVSDRFGFSIGHPASWSEQPADHDWTLATDAADTAAPASFSAWERFTAADKSIGISAWSVAVTAGTTLGAWLEAYSPIAENTSWAAIQDKASAVDVDGHAGLLVPFTEDTQAFVLVDNRIYVVASWRPAREYGSLELLRAFVSTMHLLPGGPLPATSSAPPSASPRPS